MLCSVPLYNHRYIHEAVADKIPHMYPSFYIRYLQSGLIKPSLRYFAFYLLVLPISSQASEESSLSQSLHLGGYYSNGDYGEPIDTAVIYLPFSYELNSAKWGFQLTVPYIDVNGLGNVLINVGGATKAVAGTEITDENGLGDSIAAFTYRLDPVSSSAPFIDLRLNIKIPTADESKTLGTGEADYSLQIDLTQQLGGFIGFASLGYTLRGTTELFEGLEDSFYVQLGVDYPLSNNLRVGAFYDYREAASSLSDEVHEIVPYISKTLSEKWTFTAFTTIGFTDASADYAVLGQFSYRW